MTTQDPVSASSSEMPPPDIIMAAEKLCDWFSQRNINHWQLLGCQSLVDTSGGPAFPIPGLQNDADFNGMTLRQYSAIKLKVPNSGTDWLDAMIRESLRDDFAKKMISVLASERDDAEDDLPGQPTWESFQVAGISYDQADAMLKAREAS